MGSVQKDSNQAYVHVEAEIMYGAMLVGQTSAYFSQNSDSFHLDRCHLTFPRQDAKQ